ncbi:DinB family protein [Numidum massiliense]|uniref:DinB family protein n=1 Tax=Numidum massiliense TaxID=1522315 RepID=UPI0006D57F5C|nr:DinB family protein [Numidum massiliense]
MKHTTEARSAQTTLQELEALIQHYVQELDNYTLKQLTYKPQPEQWSLGQMYNHLIKSALYMQFPAVEQCALVEASDGEKTAAGEQIFRNDAFPPTKIKVPPSPAYTPQNPGDKDELHTGMTAVLTQARTIADKLETVSSCGKVRHPGFGALNAHEWFQLTEMHFRHHLRQKKEIDNLLQQ